MITNKTIIRSVLLLISLLIIPNILYLLYFYKNSISENPEDWAQFATYFGGILNPIIAIFGTLILGYLSIQIGKQSSEENKNLFILEQKILAYQKLAQNLEIIEIQMFKTVDTLLINSAFKGKINSDDIVKKYVSSLEDLLLPMAELQSTLNNFPTIYGHLFKYDFDNTKYIKLIKSCEDFVAQSKNPLKNISDIDDIDVKKNRNVQKKFLDDFKNLLKVLKSELS